MALKAIWWQLEQEKDSRIKITAHKSAADFLLVFSRCVLSAGATWASRLSSKLCFLSPLRWKSESLKLQWVTRYSSSTHCFPLKWWTNTNLSYLFYKSCISFIKCCVYIHTWLLLIFCCSLALWLWKWLKMICSILLDGFFFKYS